MSKILVIGKYYPPYAGGIETNTQDVAESLAKYYSVTVLCFNHKPGLKREVINDVEVVRFGLLGAWFSQPVSLRMFWETLVTKADVIHFHAPNFPANVALFLRKMAGDKTPVVVTHHMDVYGRRFIRAFVIPFYKYITNHAYRVIVTSLKNARISCDIGAKSKIQAIPLSIRIEDYASPETPGTLKKTGYTRPANCQVLVGFVGRHSRYKGLDVLMKALAQVPDVSAVIVGDGEFRARAESLAEQLEITDRVHFLGLVSQAEKLSILSQLDIFAFPSTEITEAFGISQLEAMIMGASVVASDLPTGVTDVSVHEDTALLVKPGDHVALAAAIRRLAGDEALRASLASNAYKHVVENFTHDVMVRKTLALFGEVLLATN